MHLRPTYTIANRSLVGAGMWTEEDERELRHARRMRLVPHAAMLAFIILIGLASWYLGGQDGKRFAALFVQKALSVPSIAMAVFFSFLAFAPPAMFFFIPLAALIYEAIFGALTWLDFSSRYLAIGYGAYAFSLMFVHLDNKRRQRMTKKHNA